MEFKGTKGIWQVIHVSNDRGDYHKVMVDNTSICNITTRNEIQSEANAKLISCAPEMLEMLIKIEKNYDKGTQTYIELTNLIKKATEL